MPRSFRPWTIALALAACAIITPPTYVTVSRTPMGDRALRESGTNLPVSHWELDASRQGLTTGFRVVKSELEWRALWPNTDEDKIPLLPRDLDLSHEMLIIAVPEGNDVVGLQVKEAVDTDETGVHLYLSETVPGFDCPARERDPDAKNFDLARVRRIDGKEVHFHIDTARADPCGDAPRAAIRCRPNGTTTPFLDKLSVSPGTAVACVASDFMSTRPILDITWSFAALPSSTFARATIAPGGKGVSFTTDVFGSYKLLLEVTDDLQRKGASTLDVDVSPPKDSLVLELAWNKFDPTDDPTTFPRIELHSLGVGGPQSGIRWGAVADCNVERPPAWCTAKATGSTTVMTVDPAAAKELAVGVHYTDERFAGGAIACVRAYRNGKRQAELCDPSPRKGGAWWDAGTIDVATGKTPQGLAQEKAMAAAAAAKAAATAAAVAAAAAAKVDAGAADASAHDAGPTDAASPARDGSAVDATAPKTTTNKKADGGRS